VDHECDLRIMSESVDRRASWIPYTVGLRWTSYPGNWMYEYLSDEVIIKHWIHWSYYTELKNRGLLEQVPALGRQMLSYDGACRKLLGWQEHEYLTDPPPTRPTTNRGGEGSTSMTRGKGG